MLNHISIMGRICNDIELRRTGSGKAVVSFTLAVERDFKGSGGEKETDFIECVAWKNTAEFVHSYFSKGRMAIVAGRLHTRNWEDKNGNKRKTTEVITDNVYFGDSKKEDSADGNLVKPEHFGQLTTATPSDFAMLEEEDAQFPF